MFKRIQLTAALLFLSASISTYAYTINSNFTVDNQTDTPMVVHIASAPGQKPTPTPVAAKSKVTIPNINNGDTGLYTERTIPYTINNANTGADIANGNIVFYVWGSEWGEFSYMDEVKIDSKFAASTSYQCTSIIENPPNGNEVAENAITLTKNTSGKISANKGRKFVPLKIEGRNTPLGATGSTIPCVGFESSSLNVRAREDNNPIAYDYTANCHDPAYSPHTFLEDADGQSQYIDPTEGCQTDPANNEATAACYWYYDEQNEPNNYYFFNPNSNPGFPSQGQLDQVIGTQYCYGW